MGWAARANRAIYQTPKARKIRVGLKRPEFVRAWALLAERIAERVPKYRVRQRAARIVRRVFRYRKALVCVLGMWL